MRATGPKLVIPEYTMEFAFPDVSPGIQPFGSRIVVQVRRPRTHSAGGIEYTPDIQETEKWNTVVAKVVAIGPAAFRNRDTLDPWPEGAWCQIGDFIWTPQYGGQKHDRVVTGTRDRVMFKLFNDLDLLGATTIDPREILGFI